MRKSHRYYTSLEMSPIDNIGMESTSTCSENKSEYKQNSTSQLRHEQITEQPLKTTSTWKYIVEVKNHRTQSKLMIC